MTESTESASSTFPAELTRLRPMLAFVRMQLKSSPFGDAEIRRIEIALEEALVNIIHYAYQGREGVIEITYRYYPLEQIEIIIKDYGTPFNPLENGKKVSLSPPAEERPVGGLGITLIKGLMDHLEYLRENDANILTLKKKCN